MSDAFELPILVFFQLGTIGHHPTLSMCDSLAEISRAIVEIVRTDVVPAAVSEGAEKVVVWTEGENFG